MAATIDSGARVYTAPLATTTVSQAEQAKAQRDLQAARTEEEQATNRRRQAQQEMRAAEERLQRARRAEREASEQVRAAQAEQARLERAKTAPAAGEILSIFV